MKNKLSKIDIPDRGRSFNDNWTNLGQSERYFSQSSWSLRKSIRMSISRPLWSSVFYLRPTNFGPIFHTLHLRTVYFYLDLKFENNYWLNNIEWIRRGSVHDLFNEIDTLYDEHVTNGGLGNNGGISSLSRISNNSENQKYLPSSGLVKITDNITSKWTIQAKPGLSCLKLDGREV